MLILKFLSENQLLKSVYDKIMTCLLASNRLEKPLQISFL